MKTFMSILALLPGILAGVKAVENAVGAGHGQAKKDIVMSGILAAAQAGEKIDQPTVQAVSSTIDYVVSILNASGVLGKPADVPPVPPAA